MLTALAFMPGNISKEMELWKCCEGGLMERMSPAAHV
jgi:hypothetical protein